MDEDTTFDPILSPKELFETLIVFIKNRLALFILGDPGQGKTQITRQAAEHCGADFVPIFLPSKDPVDIIGYPTIVEVDNVKKATFLPFGDMEKLLTAEKPTVCFADDLGPSAKLMQAAWMQCVCEREISGHKISDNVVFISASNLKGGNTGVSTILEPLMNKHVSVVQLKNNFVDWCEHATNTAKLPYEIVYFTKWQPAIFDAYEPMTDLSQTPTARGIEHCAQIFKTGINSNIRARLFAGAIGKEYAVKLDGFLRFYKDLPNPDLIIADPDHAEIPEEPGPLWALCCALAKRASETSIEAIIIC
jgi:hypothetical protein